VPYVSKPMKLVTVWFTEEEKAFLDELAKTEDVTLSKDFRITEFKRLQLRLEAYSLTNSPQWGNPNTSFESTSFGQITSAGGNRTVQVAAKFYY